MVVYDTEECLPNITGWAISQVGWVDHELEQSGQVGPWIIQ